MYKMILVELQDKQQVSIIASDDALKTSTELLSVKPFESMEEANGIYGTLMIEWAESILNGEEEQMSVSGEIEKGSLEHKQIGRLLAMNELIQNHNTLWDNPYDGTTYFSGNLYIKYNGVDGFHIEDFNDSAMEGKIKRKKERGNVIIKNLAFSEDDEPTTVH